MSLTHALVGKDGFRLRGTAMSRVDGFSDVVFGFAITLIVASLEVPKTFDELHSTLLGFFPFSICFVFLMMVWLTHFRFFRRFGLHDLRTILVNAALLFTVLFYVYPMKFMFTLVGSQYVAIEYAKPAFRTAHQVRELVELYAFGFVAIYSLLTLLNLGAWWQRHALDLNKLERTILVSETVDLAFVAVCGALVMIIALLLPPEHAYNACFGFFLIGIWKTITGAYFGKKIRVLRSTMVPEPLPTAH